jgi:hypothetical protein
MTRKLRMTVEIPGVTEMGEELGYQHDALTDMIAILSDIREHLAAIRDNTDKITAP